MHPTIYLEWWHAGAWHRIGWDARTPESANDLRKHGADLAANGGQYRLTQSGLHAERTVIHEFTPRPPRLAPPIRPAKTHADVVADLRAAVDRLERAIADLRALGVE